MEIDIRNNNNNNNNSLREYECVDMRVKEDRRNK